MPIHSYPIEFKSLNDEGTFVGFASVYGVQDLGGDIVEKGAFTRTLSEGGKSRPILWQHQQPVGVGTLEDGDHGLVIRGKLTMAVAQAKEALALMRDGAIKGLSIGFSTIKDEVQGGVRHLRELKLYEVSLVTFPMNEHAQVTSVKSIQQSEISRAARELRDFYAALKNQTNRSNYASR